MKDIAAFGELLIDFAPVSEGEGGYPVLAAQPGGAPANFLAAAAARGCSTAFIGKVGDDAFGRQLVRTLEEAGIDTKGTVISPDVFTTLAFVTLDEKGDREFSFARKPGADMAVGFEELDLSVVDDAKVIHFGTLSLTDEPAKDATHRLIGYASEKGKMISFDPNYRQPLWKSAEEAVSAMKWGLSVSDIVKISDNEIGMLYDAEPAEAAELLMKDYPGIRLLYVTCGADGALYRSGSGISGKVNGQTGLNVIDTTGAGDIFGGTAMAEFLKLGKAPEELTDDELRHITETACNTAGLSTEKHGGIFSIPKE